jgi:hypothetical protein
VPSLGFGTSGFVQVFGRRDDGLTTRSGGRRCEGKDDSANAIDNCMKEHAGEIGKVLRAEANCEDLTIQPSGGGQFKFYKMGEDYVGKAPVWTNLANGEIECGARACEGPSASTHFDRLCPAVIPGWGGRRLTSK